MRGSSSCLLIPRMHVEQGQPRPPEYSSTLGEKEITEGWVFLCSAVKPVIIVGDEGTDELIIFRGVIRLHMGEGIQGRLLERVKERFVAQIKPRRCPSSPLSQPWFVPLFFFRLPHDPPPWQERSEITVAGEAPPEGEGTRKTGQKNKEVEVTMKDNECATHPLGETMQQVWESGVDAVRCVSEDVASSQQISPWF